MQLASDTILFSPIIKLINKVASINDSLKTGIGYVKRLCRFYVDQIFSRRRNVRPPVVPKAPAMVWRLDFQ